ncbi:MAG: transporter substrate-binding domain-containing protein [Desulfamplus sp.]|nr:transporter substrate-binding domain-containing protein [Desulfamplus sp.]
MATEIWEPYNFVKDGKVIGISTEIVEYTIKQAGIAIKEGEIGVYPWARAYKMALEDENVLIYTILRTEEREKLFKWIGPLIPPEKFYFYKHRTRSDVVVKTLDHAKKYRIGILRDSIHGQFLTAHGFPKYSLDEVSEQVFNLKKLLADRIDLIIDLETTLKIRTQEQNLPLPEFEQVLFLFEHGYYMAFSQSTSEKIVERTRSAFEEVKASGVIQQILKKYNNNLSIAQ